MVNITDFIGEEVLTGLLDETLDEIGGRNNRKWAVVLLALLVGAGIATFVIRRRAGRAAAGAGQDFSGASGSSVPSSVPT